MAARSTALHLGRQLHLSRQPRAQRGRTPGAARGQAAAPHRQSARRLAAGPLTCGGSLAYVGARHRPRFRSVSRRRSVRLDAYVLGFAADRLPRSAAARSSSPASRMRSTPTIRTWSATTRREDGPCGPSRRSWPLAWRSPRRPRPTPRRVASLNLCTDELLLLLAAPEQIASVTHLAAGAGGDAALAAGAPLSPQ